MQNFTFINEETGTVFTTDACSLHEAKFLLKRNHPSDYNKFK